MENPKIVNRVLALSIIVTGILNAGVSIFLHDYWPILIWGFCVVGFLVISLVIAVLWGVTLVPLLWLVVKILPKKKDAKGI
jgi:hypothetical protein